MVRVEGELPEFINLVSSDLMVDDEPGEGLSPSSFIHQFGKELAILAQQ